MLGPWVLIKLFLKPVFLCWSIIFWVLFKSRLIYLLVLPGFKFYLKFPVLTILHSFSQFSGPDATYVPTVLTFPGIISDVTEDYSTWMVRKTKYTKYFYSNYILYIVQCTFLSVFIRAMQVANVMNNKKSKNITQYTRIFDRSWLLPDVGKTMLWKRYTFPRITTSSAQMHFHSFFLLSWKFLYHWLTVK